MAKLSSINKNERRKKLVKRNAARYAKLKAIANDESKDDTERLIEGRWVPRDDAPGIVLRGGEQGADWSLYDVSDQSARETHGRAQIYLSADCCTPYTAQRIPVTVPEAVAAGDRVFELRDNGSYRLGTVAEVNGDRVKVEFRYLGSEWVERKRLRSAEW